MSLGSTATSILQDALNCLLASSDVDLFLM